MHSCNKVNTYINIFLTHLRHFFVGKDELFSSSSSPLLSRWDMTLGYSSISQAKVPWVIAKNTRLGQATTKVGSKLK
jgi:hypothetical protein